MLSAISQTHAIWFHLYVESKRSKHHQTNKQKTHKKTHRNRDQREGYQKGGSGRMGEKGKGNAVNNTVLSLHGDRLLLELVG